MAPTQSSRTCALAALLLLATACNAVRRAPALGPTSDPYQAAEAAPASPGGAGSGGPSGLAVTGFEVGDRLVRDVQRTLLAYPTGDPSTSTLLVERMAPGVVRSGEPVVFRMRVSNLTDQPLEDVVLTERIDPNFGFARADPPADVVEGESIVWRLGRLEPRGQRFIELSGRVERGPSLEHLASVECRPLLRSSVRVESPELRLHLTGPAEIGPCDALPLRVTLTNSGRAPTDALAVLVPLPAGLSTQLGRSSVELPFAPLAVGQSRVARVDLRATAPGAYPLRATVTTDLGRSASEVITPIVRMADLAVRIESEGEAYVGDALRYRISLRNDGDGVLRNARVELTSPAGCDLLSASPGARHVEAAGDAVIEWELERLHPGEEVQRDAVFVTAASGTAHALVRLVPPCGAPVVANDETDVLPRPELVLRVSDGIDPAAVGEAVPYDLRLTNRGAAPVHGVVVAARLDRATELLEADGVSAAGPVVESAGAHELRFAPLAELGPGEEATWRIVLRSRSASRRTLQVRVDSQELALPVEVREGTLFHAGESSEERPSESRLPVPPSGAPAFSGPVAGERPDGDG